MSEFSANELAQIAPALQGVVDSGALSGAVTLLWRNGEIADVTIVGLRDVERGLPMERNTLFRIASMTKPVTSVAALILMEEGKLKLSDRITKWAPEFSEMAVLRNPGGPLDDAYPASRDITIDDLLTHRSGLAYDFTSAGPLASAYRTTLDNVSDRPREPDAWMKALGTLPLSYSPGDRFHYSHSTDVLGFIIGRVAGQPFSEFLRQRVFAPLGMSDTSFHVPPAERNRAAIVYRYDTETGSLRTLPLAHTDEPPAFASGGGGLFSTADDYLTFARMLLGKGEVDGMRILRPETTELMTRNRLSDRQREFMFMGLPFWRGQGFGLGVSVVLDAEKQSGMSLSSNGAFGWPGAFGTWWQADPVENMVLIYMVQDLRMPVQPRPPSPTVNPPRIPARQALSVFQALAYRALAH